MYKIFISLLAVAATIAAAKDVDARKMTCEEFAGLEETVKPQLVLFIEGSTRSGKPEGAMVTLDEISRPVAFVVEECRKTPKATVWQKVENYVKTVGKKL